MGEADTKASKNSHTRLPIRSMRFSISNLRDLQPAGCDRLLGRKGNPMKRFFIIALCAVPGALAQTTQPGEWPAYAGDLRNYHYSPLSQIDASNFNKLEIAWRFKTDSLGTRPEYKLEGTPLMMKGVVYATAGTRRD